MHAAKKHTEGMTSTTTPMHLVRLTTQRASHSFSLCVFFQRWNLDATGAHPWPYVSRDYSPELQGMLAVHKWGLVCVLEIPWDSGMLHVRGFGWQVDCLPKG